MHVERGKMWYLRGQRRFARSIGGSVDLNHKDDVAYREFDHGGAVNDLTVTLDTARGVALLTSTCPTCKAVTLLERRMGHIGSPAGTKALRADASAQEKPLRDYFICRCGFVHKKGDEVELGCGTTWDASGATN